MRYRVKIRRGAGFEVKPEAEEIDGNVYDFTVGWKITEEDSSIYVGEYAMIPTRLVPYPTSAPIWIASGDLEAVT